MKLMSACLRSGAERLPTSKLACFAMIALHAGLRRTEILTLQRSRIELGGDPPFLSVAAALAKSRKDRPVGINATLRDFLAERLPLLPERDPFKFRGVDQRFKRMVVEAKLSQRITAHKLRQTFATRLASRRVPVNEIQALLGHADLQTSSIYIHAAQRNVLEATRVLDQPVVRSMFERD